MTAAPRRIIIIGAARSGTKLLRDSLASAVGGGVVPYDIGYVWRAGMAGHPDDRLSPGELDGRRERWIRDIIDRYADGIPRVVVEKSVGNVMRVPYVATVFPDAFYVHLVRDGTDVVESTYRQWVSPHSIGYLARKVRHVPLRVLPGYGVRYVRSMAHRWLSRDHRVGSWGPRYPGIDADLANEPLLTVCARQWRNGVTFARADLAASPVDNVEVRYEDLVREPVRVLTGVAESAGLQTEPAAMDRLAASFDDSRVGYGPSVLAEDAFSLLETEIGPLLTDLGYARPRAPTGGGP